MEKSMSQGQTLMNSKGRIKRKRNRRMKIYCQSKGSGDKVGEQLTN